MRERSCMLLPPCHTATGPAPRHCSGERGAARPSCPVRRTAQRTCASAMAAAESYSLWIQPSGPIQERLAAEINHLADRHPGAPRCACAIARCSVTHPPATTWGSQLGWHAARLHARRFLPHVTLLGDIQQPRAQVLETAHKLASQLKVSAHTARLPGRSEALGDPSTSKRGVGAGQRGRTPAWVTAWCALRAPRLQKYRINFQDAVHGTFYFQCVFLLCAKDPDTMAAAQLAR